MLNWYAVLTKPRRESEALAQLKRQGFEAWLPMVRERKRQREPALALSPLFPRYLFTRVDLTLQDVSPIRSTVGCCGLVRFGAYPAPVPEAVIERLQALEDDAGYIHLDLVETELHPGDPLRVTEGPLEGLRVLFQARTSQQRVVVLLEWMGTQRPLTLPAGGLEPLRAA